MSYIIDLLKQLDGYKKVNDLMLADEFSAALFGLLNINKAHFVASFKNKLSLPVLVLAKDDNSAEDLAKDISSFGLQCGVFPYRDFNFYDILEPLNEFDIKRINCLSRLAEGDLDVVVAPVSAALQYTIPPKFFAQNCHKLGFGEQWEIEDFLKMLLEIGYKNCSEVVAPGEFFARGGIVDVFSFSQQKPSRIEFFGDEIDTICSFDIETQRRLNPLSSLLITPATEVLIKDKNELAELINGEALRLEQKGQVEAAEILKKEENYLKEGLELLSRDKFIEFVYKKPCCLLDYFLKESPVFVSDCPKICEEIKRRELVWNQDLENCLQDGVLCTPFLKFSFDEIFLQEYLKERKVIYLENFLHGNFYTSLQVEVLTNCQEIPSLRGSFSNLLKKIKEVYSHSKDSTIILSVLNRKDIESTRTFLEENNINSVEVGSFSDIVHKKVSIVISKLAKGFFYKDLNTYLFTLTEEEPLKNNVKKGKKSSSILSPSDLSVGDFVVHHVHGIGKFVGAVTISSQGVTKEYLKIVYKGEDALYVPVTSLNMIDKYIGAKEGVSVSLNSLKSNDFVKTKKRVKAHTEEIAKELILLYSQRINTKGYAFAKDNEAMADFESLFPFEETADQKTCIKEIKEDMEKAVPMERLLVGDVGFGKTEVALRAAFKCVSEPKQCAMLAPTTILAWQHYKTAKERFKDYPVNIELLSRFKSEKQQKETLKNLKSGKTDLVIGTHKLLNKKIEFRDLGLFIIDEEQRFGVKQKEFFKNNYKTVDSLILSATPIPRTLNMALSGIRDMCEIREAPPGRQPITTYVLEYNNVVIEEAIRKELRRGGQIYYIHNRVDTILRVAHKLQNMFEGANVAVAHGKMKEDEISDVWTRLLDKEIDILVSTTIIETGIDIKNVNTLIIENADRMGLAQLHQIRGRIGRSDRRAYAYFTFNRDKSLSDISTKRLNAIRDFSEMGSGFKIAKRDLELRGAGNILSSSQHGHLSDVGYEMYIKMLDIAVKKEKGEEVKDIDVSCSVDLDIDAFIPEGYIKDTNTRLDFYRKISFINSEEEKEELLDELIDRFGDPPKQILYLIDIVFIKKAAQELGVIEIKQQPHRLIIKLNELEEGIFDRFSKSFKNRLTLGSGSVPCFYIKIDESFDVLKELKRIF